MAYLILDRERFALQIGDNTLGGAADDTVFLPALAELPPLAVITNWPGSEPTISRVAPDVRVTVDGAAVGASPRKLVHGARIEVGGLRLVYGDLETSQGTTTHVVGVSDQQVALLAAIARGAATAPTGGRLIELRTGRVFAVADAGLAFGRDPECDVVLSAKDVSRHHAVLKPSLYGYVLTDNSANGVYVNDTRVGGQHVLAQGDVVRVADTEFRFEADLVAAGGTRASAGRHEAPGDAPAGAVAPDPLDAPDSNGAVPLPPRPAPLLATLEVVTRGAPAGPVFRIDRVATTIGRAEHRDVHLTDRSVSGAHATLLLKGGTWYVVDLDSTNGTYVDGVRVAGERALPGECTLRVGDVKMLFRPVPTPATTPGSTRRIEGIGRR